MSRLTIDITDQQHQSLKAMAALQGKSIKQYALERLFPQQADDEQAWGELKALVQQRIASGLAGEVSAKGFDAIVDEELDRAGRA
ncbi:MAG TPA: antitoxin [Sphingobium sp.]|uniref:antitoxin n=1 Tax=Sphingobium sp. TaxID=1912891 RepID=UPI002ED33EAF